MEATKNASMTADAFRQRIADHDQHLTPACRRVVTFIDQNRGAALASSAMDMAHQTGTSDATVVRAVQALGFQGLPELKAALAEAVDAIDAGGASADNMRRTLEELGQDAERAMDDVFDVHGTGLTALTRPGAKKQMTAAVQTLQQAKRVALFGVGPTGFIAHYAASLLTRSGRDNVLLTATGSALADQLLSLRSGDVLLALAYVPGYREVLAAFQEARRLGLRTILITDSPKSELCQLADTIVIAQRGRHGRVALHGTTVICLEAMIVALSATNKTGALSTLNRLSELRRSLAARRPS